MYNIIKNVWSYIKPSWEGEDGQFSYRRASQFVFIFLIVHIVLSGKIINPYGFYALIVLVITFLLTAMIISVPQLLQLLGELNQLKKINPFKADGNEPPNVE